MVPGPTRVHTLRREAWGVVGAVWCKQPVRIRSYWRNTVSLFGLGESLYLATGATQRIKGCLMGLLCVESGFWCAVGARLARFPVTLVSCWVLMQASVRPSPVYGVSEQIRSVQRRTGLFCI